jgi:hypothetical protein
MAFRMRDSRLLVAYPAIRLCWLLGFIRGTSLRKLQFPV